MPDKPLPPPDYFLGCDLGQSQDFTALAALERTQAEGTRPGTWTYTVRGLKRFELGSRYPSIVRDVVELVSTKPLAGCVLGIDQTGVGAAVVDMFREAKPKAKLRPV